MVDTGPKRPPRINGESQITISKKWVAIITVVVVAFVVGVGWMYQVVATARPLSAEYAKEHGLRVSGQDD